MGEDLVTAQALADRAGEPLSTIAAYAKGGLIHTYEDYHGRKRFRMTEALGQIAWAKANKINPEKNTGRWRLQLAERQPDGRVRKRRRKREVQQPV